MIIVNELLKDCGLREKRMGHMERVFYFQITIEKRNLTPWL